MPWNIQPQSVASSQTCELTHIYAANNVFLGTAKIKLATIYAANNVLFTSENRRVFCRTKNEKRNGGKAIKTGLCKRVSAKPVFAAALLQFFQVLDCSEVD